MNIKTTTHAEILSDPIKIYYAMLNDIEQAKEYIYLETYRFENDPIGVKFRNLLCKKARQGLKVMLLVDAWGTSVSERFFRELVQHGGQVKFFKKVRLALNIISANHERDHRKLLVIDNKISYISSLNISNYNLNWREISLRLHGDITDGFRRAFLDNYQLKNTYKFDKKRASVPIRKKPLMIIRDVPSVRITRIRKKLLRMIKKAKKQIIIESPYFLPTFLLREGLMKAAQRGVDVQVIMPRRSDVAILNIFRQRYLGKLHESGVRILYYLPSNLHAKLMIADDQFYMGSANFDYRSFRYQFEIGLFGKEEAIYKELMRHVDETREDSEVFDYEDWKNRRMAYKLIEWLLLPLRHFL